MPAKNNYFPNYFTGYKPNNLNIYSQAMVKFFKQIKKVKIKESFYHLVLQNEDKSSMMMKEIQIS